MDILVVDDKEANRKLLNSYLTMHGFTVLEADSGDAAVQLFDQHQPGLVLMDIMMPGMDGYDAAAAIKNSSTDVYTPLIYVTALKPEEAMSKAVEAGGDDFITKPVNFEILISKINAHIRIKEAHQKLAKANELLSAHNQRLTHENELVEHIFNNALSKSCLDERFVRYHLRSVSAFNGDILLAEKKPDGNVCVLLGDFTGHGLSAAVGSLPVIKVFFTMVRKGLSIKEIAKELNDTIKMLLPGNIFLCASLIEMNGGARSLNIWTGGLPPMILHDPGNNTINKIKSQHMALGILAADDFVTDIITVDVMNGQKLYLYTDGVIEARNQHNEMYGSDRLEQVFVNHPDDPYSALIKEHQQYLKSSHQEDDLTLIELSCDQLPLT